MARGREIKISERELERLLLAGCRHTDIAVSLRCGERTIKRKISKLREKYGDTWGRTPQMRPLVAPAAEHPELEPIPSELRPPAPPKDLEDATAVASWARAYFAWVATVPVAAMVDPGRIRAAEQLLRLTPPPAPRPPEPDHSDLLERVLAASETAVGAADDDSTLPEPREAGIH